MEQKSSEVKTINNKNADSVKDLFLIFVIFAAIASGLSGIILFPKVFLGVDNLSDSGVALTFYFITSMILVMAGIQIKQLVGRFLMLLGISIIIFAVYPYITNYKTIAGFLVILATFILLVYLIIRSHNKDKNG